VNLNGPISPPSLKKQTLNREALKFEICFPFAKKKEKKTKKLEKNEKKLEKNIKKTILKKKKSFHSFFFSILANVDNDILILKHCSVILDRLRRFGNSGLNATSV